MKDNKENLIVIGQIGSPHGIRGWLHVRSFTEPPENILNYNPWVLISPNKSCEVKIISSRFQGNSIAVQFENCNDRDTASTFTGAEVVIHREQLPALDANEYYWADLIGLSVINKQDQLLGIIEKFFSTGSNDVFVVVGEKRHLLPYLMDEIVLDIDLEKKIMRVDWDPEF